MRYMMIVSGPENLAASGPPPAALGEAIDRLIEEDTKSGKLVSFGGLKPTADGARIRSSKGKLVTTDGPFTEAKEVIGGFAIMQCKSREELLEWTHRFLALAGDGECEIHQLSEMSPLDQLKQHQL